MTTLMTQNPAMRGEKIYEYEFDITGVTDYGVSMDAILANKGPIPPQGARFDLAVTGRGKGRLSGRAHGVDYLRIRADGGIELDLHVSVETDDGRRIALSGDGQAAPRKDGPIMDMNGYLCKHPSLHRGQRICIGQCAADLGRRDREPGYWEDARRGTHAMKARPQRAQ
jgi:Protein of unknown function (DUF3237)